jgi:AcrR family transcriptional regulator
LRAAEELFVDRGYAGTTIAAIAAAAGVAVETIYRAFDGKAGLFKEVVAAAVAGGAAQASIPPQQRRAVLRMRAEPDARRLLELHAATQPGIQARIAALFRLMLEAAPLDSAVAELWNEIERDRLHGMTLLARGLSDRGALRAEVSVEQAAEILWAINSPGVYQQLVVQAGWSPKRYQQWLATTNALALLG